MTSTDGIYAYITCPICGMNREMSTAARKRLPNPADMKIIVFRKQHPRTKGGKCKGFPTVGGLTLKEAWKDQRFRPGLTRIRNQLLTAFEEMERSK